MYDTDQYQHIAPAPELRRSFTILSRDCTDEVVEDIIKFTKEPRTYRQVINGRITSIWERSIHEEIELF